MPERTTALSRSEKSAEVVVVGDLVADEGPNEEECSAVMAMRRAVRQIPAPVGRTGEGGVEAASGPVSDEARRPRCEPGNTGPGLLEAALARENLQQAWKRVRANKGAAGIDGLDIDQTAARLRTAWPVIREQLLSGTYRPYVQSGRRIVVDVDLEAFFDRVNHDILIDRLRKRIGDAGVIRLIRAYLNSGIMTGGVVRERNRGTPQGGPLSPLLANVLLDEVDKDLER